MDGGLTRVVHVLPDGKAAADAVVERLVALSEAAREEERPFALALSGGRTPEPMFRALAALPDGAERWARWQLFWCDERLVPESDPRSNFGLAKRLWFEPARFPASNLHPVETGLPAAEAASRYEAALRRHFGPASAAAFDAVVLGIGPDGHTASLFPGSTTLAVRDRWVVVEPHPPLPPTVVRVSLTLEALGHAKVAIFLVAGADKRPALSRILAPRGGSDPSLPLPAARVRAASSVEWYVDSAAAPIPLRGRTASGSVP